MRQWNNLVYKNSWRWTCKCPKHVEAIYENKIILKLFASSWYISLLIYIWCTVTHLITLCLLVCFPGVTTHCGCIFTAQYRALVSSFSRFLDQTQRRATVGRTPLDEWSIRCRYIYLTTNNTHNRQTSMPPVGFEHTISAGERPKTYALDRAATGTGYYPV